MGGCCAPGSLGAARSAAMVNGVCSSSSLETTKGGGGGGSRCCEVAEVTGAEEALGAERESSSTVEKSEATALDVEKVLRVLEIAVEREYVDGLTDYSNASHSQHQENIASLRSSLAESTTSLYSVARSMLRENASNKTHVNSLGDGELCSLEQEKLCSNKNQRLYEDKERTSFKCARRLEAGFESTHHMDKGDLSLELKPATFGLDIKDKTHDDFKQILQQILAVDSQGTTTQARAASLPEVLTDFDDYPRGSSDTNSEDAERDKKTVCNTPMTNPIYPTHQDIAGATTSIISLGQVKCQPREKLAISTSNISEGSMRAEKSCSTSYPSREISNSATDDISNAFQIDQGKIPADDSYASWLDRHSEELGWKRNPHYKRKGNLNEEETCTQDNLSLPNEESRIGSCGFNPVQRSDRGFQSDCTRCWTSQSGVPEVELDTQDSERNCVAHVKSGQSHNNKNREDVDDFEIASSTSSRIQDKQEQTSQVCSFQLGEHVNGSFKFSPSFQVDDVSHAPLKSFQIPNPSYFDPRTNFEHKKDWLSRFGKFPKPIIKSVASIQMTSPRHVLECGGAKILQNPCLMLGNPSIALREGISSSKLNSRAETPQSVLSEGRSCAKNVEHKVKVCVRMRPFCDHEKVCPLRQLLCVLGKKIVVKEYGGPALKQSLENSETNLQEFRVDYVLDDSYLQAFQVEQKEDSQRRMYESIGLPCLEYALDGYNTTVIACGQVGTGKTYTMIGDGTEEGKGLMPRLAKDLMNHLNTDFKGEFEVQVSYLEIYQDKIRDLLAAQKLELQDSRDGSMRTCAANFFDCSDESTYEHSVDYDTASNASFFEGTPRSWRTERIPSVYFDTPVRKKEYLKVREHPVTGPYVQGLRWKTVTTWEDLETVMLHGAANRTLAATPLNKLSSRGHTLFTIKLIRGGRKFVHGYPSPSFSLINLVDLAGTEKPQSAKKTSLERLEESRYINRSLAQLNDVILNLSRNKKFISYRSSALTWLLRDSLGGKSKLFLIANISPAEQDFQESVNTLRFASRANRIHSFISSDPDSKKQVIARMKKEIQVLHSLVHDLTKNKIAECVSEELRRAQQHLPLQCQGPVYERTGVQNLTKNKIAERVSEELRRAQRLPLGQSSDYDQCLTKNKIAECVTEELRRAQQLPLKCQASEYEPMGMYVDITSVPELFI